MSILSGAEPSYSELVQELEEVEDWRRLGKEVKLPEEKLRVIEKRKSCRNRVHKVLSLYCRDGRASWRDIILALQRMNMEPTAAKIEERYCRGQLQDQGWSTFLS